MRAFLVSVVAFFLSLIAGGVVAVGLAIVSGAQEEYVAVFLLTIVVAILVTVPFFIAQFLANPGSAISSVAVVLLVLIAAIGVALLVWSLGYGGDLDANRKDLMFIAGLIVPGLSVVTVQWIVVHAFTRGRVHPVDTARRAI